MTTHRMGELLDLSHVRLAVERINDMESLRARRFDPTGKPEFSEQVAHCESRGAQHVAVIYGWIEIEYTNVGVKEVGSARYPNVRCNAVLIREPLQGPLVGHDGIMDDAVF